MLFQMVEGLDLDVLLLKLVECIPWNALTSAPKGNRQWFALSTTSSQMTDSSPHQTTSSAALLLLQQTMSPTPSSTPPSAPQGLMNQNRAQTNMNMCSLQTSNQHTPQADGEVPMDTRLNGEDDLTENERPLHWHWCIDLFLCLLTLLGLLDCWISLSTMYLLLNCFCPKGIVCLYM